MLSSRYFGADLSPLSSLSSPSSLRYPSSSINALSLRHPQLQFRCTSLVSESLDQIMQTAWWVSVDYCEFIRCGSDVSVVERKAGLHLQFSILTVVKEATTIVLQCIDRAFIIVHMHWKHCLSRFFKKRKSICAQVKPECVSNLFICLPRHSSNAANRTTHINFR